MGYKVVVVGATGNVGREMLNILAEREFPVDEMRRARLAPVAGHRGVVRRPDPQVPGPRAVRLRGWDIALLSAGSDATKECVAARSAPRAAS